MIVYDCKLMEIRRAFFVGWMGCGALFFVVDGGWRMPDAWRKWGLMRAGGLSGFPGSWMSHQRCAGWLGGRDEFLVEAIVAVLDG